MIIDEQEIIVPSSALKISGSTPVSPPVGKLSNLLDVQDVDFIALWPSFSYHQSVSIEQGLVALLEKCQDDGVSGKKLASRIQTYYLMHGIRLRDDFNESADSIGIGAITSTKAIYADSDKSRDPITFYREVWKDEVEAGTVTQALVRSVDQSLIKAIRNYCARRSLDPAAVLPPPGKPGRKADRSAEFAIASIEAKREAQRRYEAKGRRGR